MFEYEDDALNIAKINEAMKEVIGEAATKAGITYDHAREGKRYIIVIKRHGNVIGKFSFYKEYFRFAKPEDIRAYCIKKSVEIVNGPIIKTATAIFNKDWVDHFSKKG